MLNYENIRLSGDTNLLVFSTFFQDKFFTFPYVIHSFHTNQTSNFQYFCELFGFCFYLLQKKIIKKKSLVS